MPSELIVRPNIPPALTSNRETSALQALSRGVREYIKDLRFVPPGGRELSFKRVLDTWASSEQQQDLPSAIVSTTDRGTIVVKQPSAPDCNKVQDGRYLVEYAELAVDAINVEFWTADPPSRDAFEMALEDYFNPVDWMSGFRLSLPHYFGAVAEYEPKGIVFVDNEEDTKRRHRVATFTLGGRIPMLRLAGIPVGQTKIQVQVDDGPAVDVVPPTTD